MKRADEQQDIRQLIGKCGFYCGSCPDYLGDRCPGCRLAHSRGDCYTFDCVDDRGLEFCGECIDFPCQAIRTRQKATVLDKAWLAWKAEQRDK